MTLSFREAGDCTDTIQVRFSVRDRVKSSAKSQADICLGGTVDLAKLLPNGAATTDSFRIVSGGGNIAQGIYTAVLEPTRVTLYFREAGDCTDTVQIRFSVLDRVKSSVKPQADVCLEGTVDLSTLLPAAGGSVDSFEIVAGGGAIASGIYSAGSSPTRVTLSFRETGDCTDTIQVRFSVRDRVKSSAMTPANICLGGTIDLTKLLPNAAATTDSFRIVAGGGTIAQGIYTAGLSPARVTLTFREAGDCRDTVQVRFSVRDRVQSNVEQQAAICLGGTVDLAGLLPNAAATVDSFRIVSGGGTITQGIYTAGQEPARVTLSFRETGDCTDTIQVRFSVRDRVRSSVKAQADVCLGGTIDLATLLPNGAATIDSFRIVAGGGVIASGIYTAGPSPARVTLSFREAGDCTDTIQVRFWVRDRVRSSVNSQSDLCLGGTVDLATLLPNGAASTDSFRIVSGGGTIAQGIYTAGLSPARVTLSFRETGDCADTVQVRFSVRDRVKSRVERQTDICLGGTIDLTTLLPNAAASTDSFKIVGGGGTIDRTAGTYTAGASPERVTLSFREAGDCTDTVQVRFSVRDRVKSSVVTQADICLGGTIDLSTLLPNAAATVDSFRIVSGGGTIDRTAKTYTAGATESRVTLSFREAGDCVDTIHVRFSVLDRVKSSVKPQADICLGGTIDLTTLLPNAAATVDSFKIVSGGGTVTQGTYTAGLEPARVTLSFREAGDCTDTVQVRFSVRDRVRSSAMTPADVCLGGTIDLTTLLPNGAATVDSFRIVSGGGTIAQGNYTAGPSPSRVTLSFREAGDCTDTVQVRFSVRDRVKSRVERQTDICLGGTIDLTTLLPNAAASTDSFKIVGGGGTIDRTAGTYTAGPSPSRVTLSFREAGDCTDTVQVRFSVRDRVKSSAMTQADICLGGTIDLTTLLPNGAATTDSFRIVAGGGTIAQGIYTAGLSPARVTLSFREAGDCTDTVQVRFSVRDRVASSVKAQADVCLGETIDLTALLPDAAASTDSFRIVSGGGTIDRTAQTYTAGSIAGRVTLSFREAGDCRDTVQVRFDVVPREPVVLRQDGQSCPGASFDLNALLPTGPRPTGTWTGPDGLAVTDGQYAFAADAAAGPVTFTFAPAPGQCLLDNTTTVEVRDARSINFDPLDLCEAGLPLDLAALEPADAQGGVWSFGGSPLPRQAFRADEPLRSRWLPAPLRTRSLRHQLRCRG